MTTAILVCASIAYTLGGVCMKMSQGLTRFWPSVGVFALFVGGAALQALGMRQAEMSVSYIFVLGLESVLAFGLGVAIFGDAVTGTRILAVVMVTAGIVLLHR